MFDVFAYAIFLLVIIGLLRYVMGGLQNAKAPKESPPATKD